MNQPVLPLPNTHTPVANVAAPMAKAIIAIPAARLVRRRSVSCRPSLARRATKSETMLPSVPVAGERRRLFR
ncbi:unannotated protein [freshwater metagenome]|uniref:Unannotated protein n=1 Tax=freshwater metagenome TaxID=449393 RepID=A0A6J7BXG1_9ZZZZ